MVDVDDVAGTIHRAYGGMPSMASVVRRDGILIYRGGWTQPKMLQDVLEDLIHFDRADATGDQAALRASGKGRLAYHEWLSFMDREPDEIWNTIELAGPKAVADYERTKAAG